MICRVVSYQHVLRMDVCNMCLMHVLSYCLLIGLSCLLFVVDVVALSTASSAVVADLSTSLGHAASVWLVGVCVFCNCAVCWLMLACASSLWNMSCCCINCCVCHWLWKAMVVDWLCSVCDWCAYLHVRGCSVLSIYLWQLWLEQHKVSCSCVFGSVLLRLKRLHSARTLLAGERIAWTLNNGDYLVQVSTYAATLLDNVCTDLADQFNQWYAVMLSAICSVRSISSKSMAGWPSQSKRRSQPLTHSWRIGLLLLLLQDLCLTRVQPTCFCFTL